MDMAPHQVPRSLTARGGGRRRQPAQTTKTRIIRGLGLGVMDTNRSIVDRLCHREAGLLV
jgi:hypothetical protein